MKHRMIFLFAVLLASTLPALADTKAEILARMESRLAVLGDLKARQVVGENNRGFVELRGSASGAAAVVDAENRDRGEVYAQIARETGASADAVGRSRAKKIAESSRPGTWLQDERGTWFRK
jgi:uncharacterized protein